MTARPSLVAEPQLFVSDIGASCDYFNRKLGFSTVFTYGDPPFYGQVQRDGAALNLRHVDAPVIDPAIRDRDILLSATVTTTDIAGLFAEYSAAGVDFQQSLERQPWGARTFIVRDPDGNLICFAGQ